MKRAKLGAFAVAAALTTSINAQEEAKPAEAAKDDAKPAAEAVADDSKPAAEAKPTGEDKPDAEAKPEATAEPKVAVTVDGVPITTAQIEQRFQAMYGNMPPEQASMMRSHATSNIKEQLISQQLLLAAADAAKIGVDEKKKSEMIDGVMETLQEGQTMEDFYKTVGMTMEEFNADVDMRVRFDALIETKTADVKDPTEEVTKKFYEDNAQEFIKEEEASARHILIKTQGITDEAEIAKKKTQIEDLRKQLIEKKGENFAELATAHSECPSGKRDGGNLGSFGRGQMVPEFDTAVFAQPVGEIGEVIKTSFGYHVLQVTERTEGGKVPYDKVKDRISEYLKRQDEDKVIQAYLEELRSKAKIVDLSAKEAPAAPAIPGLPGAGAPAPKQ